MSSTRNSEKHLVEVDDSAAPAANTSSRPKELGRIAALHIRGRKKEALAELEALLAQQPDCVQGHFIRARIQMELQDYTAASDAWEKYHLLAKGDLESHQALAQCYQQTGRWDEAASLFRSVQAVKPDDGGTLLGLGLSQIRLQEPDDAITSLTKYLETDPEHSAAKFGLAVAYQMTSEFELALELYDGLLQREEFKAEILGNLILIFRQQKDAARLRSVSEELIGLTADSLAGLEGAAFAAFLSEDFENAARWSQRVVEVDGSRHERWMNLALCHRKLEHVTEALDAYEEAIARAPQLTEAHLQILNLLAENKQIEAVLQKAERAIESCPDAGELYLALGTVLEADGKPDQAEEVYSILSDRKPDSSEAWFRLGNLQLARRSYEEAQVSLRRTVELLPESNEARLNLSLAFLEGGAADAAHTQLQQLVARTPEWEPALRTAAVASLKLGAIGESCSYHVKLIELGHGDPEVYFNAALLSEQMGKSETAVEYYERAVDLKPEFPEALVSLGHALESLGRSDEARQRWAEAMELQPQLADQYFNLPA